MDELRLIDVNELYDFLPLPVSIEEVRYFDRVIDAIRNCPIAYDIGKVVEQLEEESYDSMHIDPTIDMTKSWQIIDLDDAIKIVKKGGRVNE